jgi:hypothetical protein
MLEARHHHPDYSEDFTYWLLDKRQFKAESEAIERSQRLADDDLLEELLGGK